MKLRQSIESNYKAAFFNGKTLRFKLDTKLPFLPTKNPEIEDVAINEKCYANCSYCYTSAIKEGKNYSSITQKAIEVWGSLPVSERPFQIAIGGAGESTLHPDWCEFVSVVSTLGILPNYTTNGMHLSSKIIEYTKLYCGGVALSYHPHIPKVFKDAMEKLIPLRSHGIKLNTHIILGTSESFSDLKFIYENYKDNLDYFVILPYQAAGRGKEIETEEVWIKTFDWIANLDKARQSQFAFGALFYTWIKDNSNIELEMDIYEPELFSGYRMMNDSYKVLRKSSYDLQPK